MLGFPKEKPGYFYAEFIDKEIDLIKTLAGEFKGQEEGEYIALEREGYELHMTEYLNNEIAVDRSIEFAYNDGVVENDFNKALASVLFIRRFLETKKKSILKNDVKKNLIDISGQAGIYMSYGQANSIFSNLMEIFTIFSEDGESYAPGYELKGRVLIKKY